MSEIFTEKNIVLFILGLIIYKIVDRYTENMLDRSRQAQARVDR